MGAQTLDGLIIRTNDHQWHLQTRLAGFVHDQCEQRSKHQVDERHNPDALPAAIGSEEEVWVPVKEDHISEDEKEDQADAEVKLAHRLPAAG